MVIYIYWCCDQDRDQDTYLYTAMLGVFIYALFVVFTLIVSVVLLAALKWREEDGKGRVAVIVLGDLGRSPRMQYHALSLCREGYDVEFVGYGGDSSKKDVI